MHWPSHLLPGCNCMILRWITDCAKNDSKCLKLHCSARSCDELCKSQGYDGRSDFIDDCYAYDSENDTNAKSLYCVCLLKMEPEQFYSMLTEFVNVFEPLSVSGNVTLVADSLISSGGSCIKRNFMLDLSLLFLVGICVFNLYYA